MIDERVDFTDMGWTNRGGKLDDIKRALEHNDRFKGGTLDDYRELASNRLDYEAQWSAKLTEKLMDQKGYASADELTDVDRESIRQVTELFSDKVGHRYCARVQQEIARRLGNKTDEALEGINAMMNNKSARASGYALMAQGQMPRQEMIDGFIGRGVSQSEAHYMVATLERVGRHPEQLAALQRGEGVFAEIDAPVMRELAETKGNLEHLAEQISSDRADTGSGELAVGNGAYGAVRDQVLQEEGLYKVEGRPVSEFFTGEDYEGSTPHGKVLAEEFDGISAWRRNEGYGKLAVDLGVGVLTGGSTLATGFAMSAVSTAVDYNTQTYNVAAAKGGVAAGTADEKEVTKAQFKRAAAVASFFVGNALSMKAAATYADKSTDAIIDSIGKGAADSSVAKNVGMSAWETASGSAPDAAVEIQSKMPDESP